MSAPELFRRIDLTTLRLFVTVCREEHLTRAAEQENIAPSALSKRLGELEATLGVALFQRHPRGMTPTDAGHALLRHARSILAAVERMEGELSAHSQGVMGRVRILANISAIVQFLPDDLSAFYAQDTGVRVELEERTSSEVVRGIEEGVGDLGLCVCHSAHPGLVVAPYYEDRLVLAVRNDHPFAGRAEIGFLETLDYEHIGLHQDSAIYTRSAHAAAQAERSVNLRIHVPGFDAVCRMVGSGIGIGLVPDRVFEIIGRGMNIVAVPLTDDWAARELKLVSREPSDCAPAVRLLRDHLLSRSRSSKHSRSANTS